MTDLPVGINIDSNLHQIRHQEKSAGARLYTVREVLTEAGHLLVEVGKLNRMRRAAAGRLTMFAREPASLAEMAEMAAFRVPYADSGADLADARHQAQTADGDPTAEREPDCHPSCRVTDPGGSTPASRPRHCRIASPLTNSGTWAQSRRRISGRQLS